jgi:methylenetetrahydrofolate dehydrogenase (NADP+)/methenyltetrahydrofolate cyclohydrolase/formyltetrahydrofolate synthetase
VNFKELSPIVHAITPNPGGVGPMTIAMLMSNLLSAAERQLTSSRISLAE